MTNLIPINDSFVEITTKTISNLVQRQFPATYQADSPILIAFVKAYYQWMESVNSPLYYSRRYLEIKDIDKTLDQFIIFFKQKYLANIQLDTAADTRQIIKHALDIYRSKGTPQEVELLFQLVYQVPIDIYYPSTDLFRLSDGTWTIPVYLELTIDKNNAQLEGKEVEGSLSGATAFVDRVVRMTVNGRLIDIAFISAIVNDFKTLEKVVPTDGSVSIIDCSTIIGSLTDVVIGSIASGTGNNYSIGDIINISSTTGNGAIGRVANTINAFGVVDIELANGGFGYSNTANVLISNTTILISNVSMSANQWFLQVGDTVTQPSALIQYINAISTFAAGTPITTYFANGTIMGSGTITFAIAADDGISGNVIVSGISGNIDNTFWTSSNTNSAKINVFTDTSVHGTYIGKDPQIKITITNSNTQYITGETIINPAVVGTSGIIVSQTGANLTVSNTAGTWTQGQPVFGLQSQLYANVDHCDIVIGMTNTSGQFISSNGNIVVSNNILSSVCTRVFNGSGIAISVSALVDFEAIQVNTDTLGNFAAILINATSYPFAAAPTSNLTNINIGSTWTFANLTIGSLSGIVITNTGQNYDHVPIVTIDQPQVAGYNMHDYKLTFTGATSNFAIGELVIQSATGARGTVKAGSNNTVLQLENFWFANDFVNTTNSTTIIVGQSSLATANVTQSAHDHELDLLQVMGLNATFDAQFSSGNGAITEIEVIDSGYGFIEGQPVNFDRGGNGFASLEKQGKHQGFYSESGSFLSGQKKIFDGNFYQNYSYQIVSSIMLDKYQSMLKALAHPAGTKLFGRFKYTQQNDDDKSIQLGKITTTANVVGQFNFSAFKQSGHITVL